MRASEPAPGTLYLVPTPIGHLQDISLRALDILRHCDVVACEDTRVTARLLQRHGIERRTVSYHAHNEARQASRLVQSLGEGRSVALVSDAGTPGLSDPGFLLARRARQAGQAVVVLPGASAVLVALLSSGLPCQPFTFVGFLPPRRGARRKALSALAGMTHTLVFFEAARRLPAALTDMADILGPRPAAVCRELTKLYEETVRERLDRLAEHYGRVGGPRG